ncbi:hypothetical protein [Alkalihalobacillus pseudalcaliphilus]|uniref:hypothetical protein n=1 Tax=Alkalihalobacillus pseudalcaliphilus TaxID=79884 RepID=UPI00064DACF4|nr:hypothetical protein [Alkalihalobacillus pseudalcaliphilus]KMK74745.1 hypothetical protein AB990_19870 [Alkalihalobacillus pseudalcaliphilus]
MRLFFLLSFLFLLTGCNETNSVDSLSEPVIVSNNHLQIELKEISSTSYQGHTSEKVTLNVTPINSHYDINDDYHYSVELHTKDTSFTPIDSEATVTNDGLQLTAYFEEFKDEPMENLATIVIVKPTYYSHHIAFTDVTHETFTLFDNDFFVDEIAIEQNTLTLNAIDIHPIKGLDIAIEIENELIYPAFSMTDYEEDGHRLSATYEFMHDLPSSFHLHFKRNQLIEPTWTFTLPILTE